jgi:hypothetical protein
MISTSDEKFSSMHFVVPSFSSHYLSDFGIKVLRSRRKAWQMLLYLSDQVRECLRHAKICAQKAAVQSEPLVQQSFLDVEQAWLRLAQRLAELPKLEPHK